ncbi:MAG: hypothetical protein J5I90_11495 [Caldilineales bacterium]|nr:hypothetical protein [Caldilineales bacterium]
MKIIHLKHNPNWTAIAVVLLAVLFLAACAAPATAPAPTLTAEPPTASPVLPTVTPIPPAVSPIPPTPTPEEVVEETTVEESPTPAPLDPPRVEYGKITSKALEGNLLGDPTERLYTVLLPEGYNQSGRHYPVVYVLHWFTGSDSSLPSTFEREVKYADPDLVQDMIYVFPNASNVLGGSWYLSSPTIGDYETYISQEFVEQVDNTYHTIPNRNSRGITGCSMGGDGSMHLALSYPDVFSVAAPVSGDFNYANNPFWEVARATYALDNPTIDELKKLPFESRSYVAGAAAAASNPDAAPLYFDLPFEMVDGEAQIVEEVREKLGLLDATHEIHEYLEQEERLNGIMLYHGLNDDITPVELTQGFSELLTKLGVEHEYVEVPGGHCNLDYGIVLEFMSEHLAGEDTTQ